jgi:hypothetical protein
MRKIFLMLLLMVVANANITKSGDIITDSDTGLMWQDDIAVESNNTDWNGAIDYCESLELDGYSNWRLPNINELRSIVDIYKTDIDMTLSRIKDGFENIKIHAPHGEAGDYWSSSSYASSIDYAWDVDFRRGYSDYHSKNNSSGLYVRCVR